MTRHLPWVDTLPSCMLDFSVEECGGVVMSERWCFVCIIMYFLFQSSNLTYRGVCSVVCMYVCHRPSTVLLPPLTKSESPLIHIHCIHTHTHPPVQPPPPISCVCSLAMGQTGSQLLQEIEKSSNCQYHPPSLQLVKARRVDIYWSMYTHSFNTLTHSGSDGWMHVRLRYPVAPKTVTGDEIQRLKKRFMKLDRDQSGSIDKDEFLQVTSSHTHTHTYIYLSRESSSQHKRPLFEKENFCRTWALLDNMQPSIPPPSPPPSLLWVDGYEEATVVFTDPLPLFVWFFLCRSRRLRTTH
jgi:hypothetical protein